MAARKTTPSTSTSATGDLIDAEVPDATQHIDDILKVALFTPLGSPKDPECRWGLPTIFWGGSGIAKSERIEQIAAAAALPYGVIFPAQHPPEDFSGALVPGKDGTPQMYCTLPYVQRLAALGKGLLFIDEASGASPAVQGAMLGFVNDRRAGELVLPGKVRLLLAANPPKYSAGGWRLSAPSANRLTHFKVRAPSGAAWADWLITEGMKESVAVTLFEQTVINNWARCYSRIKGLGAGFMRVNSAALYQQPEHNNPQSGYCWPSPRTWVRGLRAAATAEALGLSEAVRDLMLEGCVGPGVITEFLKWVKANDLPLPEQVLIRGGWVPNPHRVDINYAVVTSCTSYVLEQQLPPEQVALATSCWKLAKALVDNHLADLAFQAATTLIRAKLGTNSIHKDHNLKNAAFECISLFTDPKYASLAEMAGSDS